MKKKLKEICTGYTKNIAQKELDDLSGDYEIFGASGLIKKIDYYISEVPYIGIVKDGSGVGRVNSYPAKSSLIGTMQYIVPNNDVDLQFLMYGLRSLNLGNLNRGAAIPHIYFKEYKEFELNVPSKEEQQKIATELDTIQSAIDNKKQQLSLLDEAVKSRFIEMFGDPVLNPMGWENKFGKELFSFSSGKFLDASKRMEKGIPVYGGNGIAWYTDIPLISFDTIIIGRVGAYCGNIKKVQEPVWVTDNAIYIKQFKEKCFNLYFLYELMSYMNFYQYADFSGQPKITQKPLENNKYIIPPIKKQKQFATFVQQIDKSKFVVKQQIADLQELLDSKMQKYFGE